MSIHPGEFMNSHKYININISGILVAVVGLAGCEGGGAPVPPTGGAGIPTNRGPVSSKMPKGAAGNNKPAAQKPGPPAAG
jgi:hypothetical protein